MGTAQTTRNGRQDLVLFSIGHSNHSLEHFLGLLKAHHILCVIDVRSVPFSKYTRHFAKDSLSATLPQHGIEYIWMGDTLGGQRTDLRTSLGIRRDGEYDEDAAYRRGLAQLTQRALTKRTAVMCSEEDPRKCHRHKIIARTLLRKRGRECNTTGRIQILHIRGNGTTENASGIPVVFQLPLFE